MTEAGDEGGRKDEKGGGDGEDVRAAAGRGGNESTGRGGSGSPGRGGSESTGSGGSGSPGRGGNESTGSDGNGGGSQGGGVSVLLPRGAGPGGRRGVRGALAWALVRSVVGVLVLGVAYFVMPLGGVRTLGDVGILVLSLIVIVFLVVFQVGRIVRADYPGLRAIEAIAFTATLLLFVFSVTYDVMDAETSAAFNVALSRLDSLYFTVTVFGTVGFGDITAHSQAARAVVTVQILFDFVFLGVAVRVIAGAVQIGRKRVAGG